MRLPSFEYFAPSSLAEAVRLHSASPSEAMYVSGGTDLFPNMKRRQFEPRIVIGLTMPELRGVESNDGLRIGAGTRLTELWRNARVRSSFPALAEAASQVSTPQLQAMGTIGGNLCLDTRCNYYNQSYHWRKSIDFCMKRDGEICWVAPGSPRCWAVSSSDCAPVALALEGTVELIGPQGMRTIPAAALYRDDGIQYLAKEPGEIVTALHIPRHDGLKSVYLKLRRRGAFDFPMLGVAAAVRFGPGGTVEHARVVLGGVGSHPVECTDTSSFLIGQRLTPEIIAGAAERAWKPARPLDNTDMSNSYRKKMARVYVARALEALDSLREH